MKEFWNWLVAFFSQEKKAWIYLSSIPKYGDRGEDVGKLQDALRAKGYKIVGPKVFGPKTKAAVSAFQRSWGSVGSGRIGPLTLEKLGLKVGKEEESSAPVSSGKQNPAYVEAKKHLGKSEYDSAFNKYLSSFWKIVGLPHYKTIIGSSFAWCALFIAAMNSETGLEYMSKYGAAARTWANYGQAIDWKKDGIPQGAVIHINSRSCSSGSGNHVTFSDSACTAATVNTPGATFVGMGGNQSNQVRRSNYSMSKVCAVRWPKEIALPSKVTKNINCNGGKDDGGSTR